MNTCKSVKMANATVHGIVMEVSPIKVRRKNPDDTLAGRSLCSAIYSCSLYLSLPHNLSFLCSAVESSLISLCLSRQPYLSFIICLHSSCLSRIIFNLSSEALLSLSSSVSIQSLFSYVISPLSPL